MWPLLAYRSQQNQSTLQNITHTKSVSKERSELTYELQRRAETVPEELLPQYKTERLQISLV